MFGLLFSGISSELLSIDLYLVVGVVISIPHYHD